MLNISKSLVSLFNRPSFHKSSIDGVRAIAVILVIIGHVFFFKEYYFQRYQAMEATLGLTLELTSSLL